MQVTTRRRGPRCKACHHPQAADIAAALARGETRASIATKFGLKKSAMWRHSRYCLRIGPAEAARAARTRVSETSPETLAGRAIVDAVLPTRENLIGRLERLSERVDELAETAKVEGHDGVALVGLSEIRKTISDIGRIAGIDRPSVAVQVNNINAPAADDIARTVLDLLRQELPAEQQVTLLPVLATRLKSISPPEPVPASRARAGSFAMGCRRARPRPLSLAEVNCPPASGVAEYCSGASAGGQDEASCRRHRPHHDLRKARHDQPGPCTYFNTNRQNS